MRVGIALNMLTKRSDASVLGEHMPSAIWPSRSASTRSSRCLDHLVTEFAFRGMPHEQAGLNLRLFADRVMPVLQRDPAFGPRVTDSPSDAPVSAGAASGGIFAPA
jgi:hypothetical protein